MKKTGICILFLAISFYSYSDVFDNIICGKWKLSNVHFMINGSNEVIKDTRSYYEWLIEFKNDGSGYVKVKKEIQVFRWSEGKGQIFIVASSSRSVVTIDEIEKNLVMMVDKQKDRTNIAILRRQIK